MATIWRADRMAEPGQREMRGFGARIYFYNEKSQAIPVDGDVVVHGYVTTPTSRKSTNDQPDKKFNYTSEQLAAQYSPSDLGASYSIWVPWDEDGFREEVTLIATFKSKKGGVVQASPTKIFLPGKSPLPDEVMPPVTQQVTYKKPAKQTYDLGPEPEKLPSTRITTIELPQKSRLNQPSLGLPTQNFYNNVPGDGVAVEVGGRGNAGSHNSPRLENLPPPPQGSQPTNQNFNGIPNAANGYNAAGAQGATGVQSVGMQPNNQLVGFQQPASFAPPNNGQAASSTSTSNSQADASQHGWGQPGWGQSRISQARANRSSVFSQPSQR